jgi:hypothetical protein
MSNSSDLLPYISNTRLLNRDVKPMVLEKVGILPGSDVGLVYWYAEDDEQGLGVS